MNTFYFDEIFFQQKKRTTKLIITWEIIDSIKRINIPGFDDDEIDIIRDLHKKLLIRSMNKNKSNEVGMLVNLQDWSDIMVDGTENGVTLKNVTKAYELLCTAPKNSLLFFHNHPKNSCFSERDLESFLTSEAIIMMSVVCNNGRLYYLIKTNTFDQSIALFHYDRIYEETESGSVQEFLRTCSSIGLKFLMEVNEICLREDLYNRQQKKLKKEKKCMKKPIHLELILWDLMTTLIIHP